MILIKNVQIIDGTGRLPFKGDVLIKGERISAIGSFHTGKAETVIDGLGLTAVPGFIDVHATSDHYLSLFSNPNQQDFLLQGVTTIIGGQCGSSIAPLLYGSFKSIRKWADTNLVNIDWITLLEFKRTLQRLKIGVNFGTLIGHSTIRRDLVGEEIRDLTQNELEVFKDTIMLALREGALGFSTGLGYAHSRDVSYREVKELLSIVAQYQKVYATHLRDEGENLLASIEEAIRIAEEAGLPTVISHLRPIIGFEDKFASAIALIEKHLDRANIYFEVNPFDVSIIPIYTLLPLWAQHGGREKMLELLNDARYRSEILEEIKKFEMEFEKFVIAEAREHPYIVGKSLKEFSENRGVGIVEGLVLLMEITKMKCILFYQNINEEVLSRSLLHPRALIGSNSASLPGTTAMLKPKRSTDTFPQFLRSAASHQLPIEEAIKKITSLPAKLFQIEKRGALREGWYADIVLLKEHETVHTIINGSIAVQDKKITGALNGIPL
jgi:N-acyl-D-amino-acid deacylase